MFHSLSLQKDITHLRYVIFVSLSHIFDSLRVMLAELKTHDSVVLQA